MPFAFAAHFAPEYLYVAAQLYREQFQPSDVLRKPYLIVAVQVIAAETDAAAQRLFTTPQQRFLRLIRNQPVELLPPVDSMEPLWQDGEREAVEDKLRAAIVGSDATVKAGLERLVSGYRRRRNHRCHRYLRTCGPAAVLSTRSRLANTIEVESSVHVGI